jgi:hypothetical protein
VLLVVVLLLLVLLEDCIDLGKKQRGEWVGRIIMAHQPKVVVLVLKVVVTACSPLSSLLLLKV